MFLTGADRQKRVFGNHWASLRHRNPRRARPCSAGFRNGTGSRYFCCASPANEVNGHASICRGLGSAGSGPTAAWGTVLQRAAVLFRAGAVFADVLTVCAAYGAVALATVAGDVHHDCPAGIT